MLEQLVGGCTQAVLLEPNALDFAVCGTITDGTNPNLYSAYDRIPSNMSNPLPHYLCVQAVGAGLIPGISPIQAALPGGPCQWYTFVEIFPDLADAAPLFSLCNRAGQSDPMFHDPSICAASWSSLFLDSYYGVDNSTAAAEECKDDNIDADRISTAQILVPIGVVSIGLCAIAGAASLASDNKGLMIGGGILGIVGGALVAAALALVITAPVYAAVGEPASIGEVVYTSGVARPLGLITIVAPLFAGILMIVGALIGGGEGGILSAKSGSP